MSDPLLPPGIRIGACVGVDERPAVRIDLAAALPDGGQIQGVVVVTPRQARALAALLLKQADLIEGRAAIGLRIIGGGAA